VTADDGDPSNNIGDDPHAVTIANVAPTVVLSGDTFANEGTTHTYSFVITDPGADTQNYAAGYPKCGANGTVTGTPTITNSGGSFQCTFFGPGTSSTVAVKVNDVDDDSNESTKLVTINLAPNVDAGPSALGAEGSAISLDGTVTDPEGDSFTVNWTYTAGAGVNAGATCSFAVDTAVDTTIKCTDDGTYTAKLEATDSNGAKKSDTTTVTVSNANPVVTAPNPTPAPYAKGSTIPASVLTVNFTDAGANDTHKAPAGGTCSVNWDDTTSSTGTVTEPVGATPGTCSSSHTYANAGVYTVTFTVTDDDGGSGTATIQVVVYDPGAGFVTGGGWIDVNAGSFPQDPSATGKGNFGFTSQYKKGATIPTGETEFNFEAGKLKFHSTSYDWLVVSSYKAQYFGAGELRIGDGPSLSGYKFRLTAYDGQISGGGGVDKFRIQIIRLSDGVTVFDNKLGASTDIDAADPQAIGGGQIMIKKA
jgi:hypothetical protein